PALYLNYFGQAALVIREPSAASNPFYLLVPGSIQLPMVFLATAATVIASQSVISGAFSMTVQAIQLDYLPTMLVKHTSASERGQVYVPAVNWVLGIGVVLLVIIFQTSSNLASAYGIAVTGTFVITTCLITVVALQRWKLSPWIVWPGFVVFFVIDTALFSANFTKFDQGGWLPLLIAFVIFAVLTTWRRGRVLMFDRLNKLEPPMAEFAQQADDGLDARRIPGAAVYLAEGRGRAPAALVRHVGLLSVLAETTVLLRLVTTRAPRVDPAERIEVSRISAGFWQVSASYGFMEQPDVQEVMKLAAGAGLPVTPDTCTYVLDLISVEPSKSAPMAMPRQRMYSVMQRVTTDPTTYMNFPPDRILGVGTVVKL
ncbi:MAG: KUP/HAK/KT family potassium transporter, partial [Actinomycetes bacterium]